MRPILSSQPLPPSASVTRANVPPSAPAAPEQCPFSDSLQPLRSALRSKLLNSSFHVFAACLADLLRALGYEEVSHAGRYRWKGKNQDGGYDLTAYARSGTSRRRVIVQVKQFGEDARVQQRMVDELRGTALRVGAAEAILLTTGRLARVVETGRREASRNPGCSALVAPLQLIEGEELLDLLIAHRTGVTDRTGTLVLDDAYFRLLEAFCGAKDNRRRRARGGASDKAAGGVTIPPSVPAPSGTLTIRIDGLPQGVRPIVSSGVTAGL